MEHFVLTGGGGKWNIVVLLPEASDTDIPKGSKLMVSEDILASIKHGST